MHLMHMLIHIYNSYYLLLESNKILPLGLVKPYVKKKIKKWGLGNGFSIMLNLTIYFNSKSTQIRVSLR